jgi:hypothetical protein
LQIKKIIIDLQSKINLVSKTKCFTTAPNDMNTNLKKAFFRILFLLFCLYGYVAHAQVPEPCGGVGQDPCPPADGAPIDTNITILIAIAVLFGIYIIHNNKLNKKRPI